MTRLIRKLLTVIDGNLVSDEGRPLNEFPAPRSLSPDDIIRGHLPLTLVEEIGVWACCRRCCFPYCDDLHRNACTHQAAS